MSLLSRLLLPLTLGVAAPTARAAAPTDIAISQALAEGAAPIYAIGFSSSRDRARREAGLKALGRFARKSGGMFVDADSDSLAGACAAMRQRIREVYRAGIRCGACVPDGNRYHLQVSLATSGLTLSDGMDLRLYPLAQAPAPMEEDSAEPQSEPGEDAVPAEPGEEESQTAPAVDSATPEGTAPPEPEAQVPGPEAPAHGWLAWWPYAAGGLGLILLLSLALRRKKPSPGADAQEAASQALDPDMAAGDAQAPAERGTSAPPPAAVAQGGSMLLTFMNGNRRGEEVKVIAGPTADLGRAADCALSVAGDDEISSRHARLVSADERVLLEDLGSTNGTYLNGVAIQAPVPVQDRDVIRIGRPQLRLELS